MAERVRSSVAKQEALMRLMNSDPGLLGSLDDDLLASITLASESAVASSSNTVATATIAKRKPSHATTTRHTLLDPRLSLDTSRRTNTNMNMNATTSRYAAAKPPTSRMSVRLYSADDTELPSRAATKHVLFHSTSVPPVLSSPEKDTRLRSNAVTRESARYPQKLLSLLDDSVFAQHGNLKKTTTTATNSARTKTATTASTAAAVQQSPLPPSLSPSRSGSGSGSGKKKAKVNTRRRAQATAPPLVDLLAASMTTEQQYEFGGLVASFSSADATEQSAVESTHSSSRGSFDSDDSCATLPLPQDVTSGSNGNGSNGNGSNGNGSNGSGISSHIDLPPPSATSSRQRASPLVLDHRCFVARDQWVVKSVRRACAVCERDFGVLRKRHSCRMCGEVICSRCSVFRAVNLSVVEGKCRICSCCSVSYRKKLDELTAEAAAGSTAVSTSTGTVATLVPAAGSDSSPSTPTPSAMTLTSSINSSSNTTEPALLTASSLSTLQQQRSEDEDDDASVLPPSPTRYDSDLSTLLSSDYSLYSSASLSSASDVSLSSSCFSSSTARSVEEELEAALRARQLEREVEASRSRIHELEGRIQEQESQKEQLSAEQQHELADARRVISCLQEQLRAQELSAREAAATRDTLCLTNLRQHESYSSGDDESRALKKKLQVLERQLQLAGINVAEVIPYELARAKVAEIARRLQEIGSSELVLADKQAQAAARREYYKLEQDMEKYNTALVMTDEYIAEQQRQDAAFEAAQRGANCAALQLLRSAMPVELSRLSEQQLRVLATPSGVTVPPELAKRLKRTNVLQLLRVNPRDIVRMHPSVIESLRTSGLTLLERRALHVVLQTPASEWKRQQMDDMSQKKFQWFTKLRDALVAAVASYEQHCAPAVSTNTASNTDSSDVSLSSDASTSEAPSAHTCKLLGLSCPVRAEARVEALYSVGLGFPTGDVYVAQDVVKSDPDGAGEKARREAQSYARELVANERQRELKAHYRMNMRHVSMAIGALEEIDAALERLETLDANAWLIPVEHRDDVDVDASEQQQAVQSLTRECAPIVHAARELALLLAKRAGICVVGKRNAANDEPDTRSPLECRSAARAVALVNSLLDDIRAFYDRYSAGGSALGSLRFALELLADVHEKNARAIESGSSGRVSDAKSSEIGSLSQRAAATAAATRVPWKQRMRAADVSGASESGDVATARISNASELAPRRQLPAAMLPTSASLFDAIRARKQQQQQSRQAAATESDGAPTAAMPTESVTDVVKPPLDLFAAIRARQAKLASAATAATGAAGASTTSA